ncbi:hypothetical protein DFH07DRAFT_940045 [Mycena maculata]|uniref:Uncharacterized protein n=1 Tax=Mycena maculata TaxID=230809 RepID=A0AAD7NFL6_9AGAR|nr:hypothetical protein DFH07DRAFT_940045 [Mycena maculata]
MECASNQEHPCRWAAARTDQVEDGILVNLLVVVQVADREPNVRIGHQGPEELSRRWIGKLSRIFTKNTLIVQAGDDGAKVRVDLDGKFFEGGEKQRLHEYGGESLLTERETARQDGNDDLTFDEVLRETQSIGLVDTIVCALEARELCPGKVTEKRWIVRISVDAGGKTDHLSALAGACTSLYKYQKLTSRQAHKSCRKNDKFGKTKKF